MADILGLGLDAAAGGVFGIVGTALGRVAGFFERKQVFKHERERWQHEYCLLYTSPSPRDKRQSRMPSSA